MELFFMLTAMLALLVPIIVGRVRRALGTARLLDLFTPLLPTTSATERVPLEAGIKCSNAELVSGQPDWPKLLAYRRPLLSTAKRQLLDRTRSPLRAGQRMGRPPGPGDAAAGAFSRAESTTLANFTRLTDALVKVS